MIFCAQPYLNANFVMNMLKNRMFNYNSPILEFADKAGEGTCGSMDFCITRKAAKSWTLIISDVNVPQLWSRERILLHFIDLSQMYVKKRVCIMVQVVKAKFEMGIIQVLALHEICWKSWICAWAFLFSNDGQHLLLVYCKYKKT